MRNHNYINYIHKRNGILVVSIFYESKEYILKNKNSIKEVLKVLKNHGYYGKYWNNFCGNNSRRNNKKYYRSVFNRKLRRLLSSNDINNIPYKKIKTSAYFWRVRGTVNID